MSYFEDGESHSTGDEVEKNEYLDIDKSQMKKKKSRFAFISGFRLDSKIDSSRDKIRSNIGEWWKESSSESPDWIHQDTLRQELLSEYKIQLDLQATQTDSRNPVRRRENAKDLFREAANAMYRSLVYNLPELVELAGSYMEIARHRGEFENNPLAPKATQILEKMRSDMNILVGYMEEFSTLDLEEAYRIMDDAREIQYSSSDLLAMADNTAECVEYRSLVHNLQNYVVLFAEMIERERIDPRVFMVLKDRIEDQET